MSDSQTFIQYLDSRQQLLEATKNTPIVNQRYKVNKYCCFYVENQQQKDGIQLRPNDQVIVEWSYADVYNPVALSVKFSRSIDSNQHDNCYKPFDRKNVNKWLIRYGSEIK